MDDFSPGGSGVGISLYLTAPRTVIEGVRDSVWDVSLTALESMNLFMCPALLILL